MSDDHPVPPDAAARWAEAQRLLTGTPDAAAELRLRRTYRRRLLALLGASLGAGVLVWLVLLLMDDGASSSPDTPLWRVVIGFALATVGCAVAGVAVVQMLRTVRRRRVRNGPLVVLTADHRKELLAQVRGQVPVDPARVGLARRLAEELLQQEPAVWTNVGLTVLWTGLAVALPSWWRVVCAVAFGSLTALTGARIQRDAASARAFLAAHPGSDA